MSRYTVPSDVDAADKLIGFLSLKQFLFVLAGFGTTFIAYTFAKANILLGIPFLPFMIVFFVLGFYQRHDQPVEVFLASWIRFKLSPRTRIWDQEGYEQHVIVTVPKKVEIDYTKGLSRDQVYKNFSSLAANADTAGWSSRGVTDANSSASSSEAGSERLVSLEAVEEIKQRYQRKIANPPDIFDANNSTVASRVEVEVDKSSIEQSQQAVNILNTPSNSASSNPIKLNHDQKEEVQSLATTEAPISTVSQQAGQAINLDEGQEFSLR